MTGRKNNPPPDIFAANLTEAVIIRIPAHTRDGVIRMTVERTLSIIKPDAVAKSVIGQVNARFEKGGLRIVASKMLQLTPKQAQEFYAVHSERPFFNGLCNFMSSGPVLAQVLEGESAIAVNRQIMGATNPKEAAAGTIRADFADSIDHNAVHGSDSAENAKQEIAFFFKPEEIVSYVKTAELA
jgi:nucleoside-diphosphate kinase